MVVNEANKTDAVRASPTSYGSLHKTLSLTAPCKLKVKPSPPVTPPTVTKVGEHEQGCEGSHSRQESLNDARRGG